MGFETILFLALGLVAILSAALMVYFKNAVHSALFLIINFGCVALLFLMLDAPFISMVQIAVYAGAIMVLFLFVIMLLGAEQTSDAGADRFGWITAVATVLAVLFVGVAVTMALLGLDLPESEGDDPLLRVVHSANITDPVDVSISGGDLEEPLVLEGVIFSDVSDFIELPAGEYTVSIGSVLEQSVTLANNEVITAIAYGDSADGSLGVLAVPLDLSPTQPDSARVQVVNLTQDDVSLIDVGVNQRLDVGTDGLQDRDIVTDLSFASVSEFIDEDEGAKSLGFYMLDDGEYVSLVRLPDWEVEEGTFQLIILTPDYGATTDDLGNYRARVLDRSQESLVVNAFSQFGSPIDIGNALFTTYLLPVNLVGFLLLVALIGVIVLTRPAGLGREKRATVNRRRKVSRPLVSVISEQTGRDVIVEDVPRLEEPDSD